VTFSSAPIAIVGNGGAAAEAVLALRSHGCDEDIHLFADNTHPPYNPMLGSYIAGGKLPAELAFPFGCDDFYRAGRVTAHLGAAVTRLDAEVRELTTAEGETYRYDRCLVASGAQPAVPPVKGLREALATGAADGAPKRVFTLQTLEDALDVRRAITELTGARSPGANGRRGAPGNRGAGARGAAGTPPRAGVVGASFAGVKVAEVLHSAGFQVVLIEREAAILPLAAHPESARIMEAHLLAEGYELRLGAALAGVKGTERIRLDFGALPGAQDPAGAGGTACEDSPSQDEVDLLVVCTGNRPALGFLTPGQVDMGTGILVDTQMRSSIPTLFAAGDVAQGKNLLSGRHEIIGLWSSARYQGRAAGRSMCGAISDYRGGLPHNITHVGRMLFASVGCVNDFDDVTIEKKGDAWQVRLRREGRLVGINLLDCCLSAGVVKQTFLRAAMGATTDLEATWTSFNA
jgi:NADPH-dependent 2,4-dienoyl-CoA reductase/sulfur reductase-like enzyme